MPDTAAAMGTPSFGRWRAQDRATAGPMFTAAGSGQRRLWFLEQLAPGLDRYNCPHALRARGRFPIAAIEQALQNVVERHASLRSCLIADPAGGPICRIAPAIAARLDVIDLTATPEPWASARAFLRRAAARPFELEQPPLWRAGCLRLAADDHILYLSAHHAVLDDWSVGVLLREIEQLVAAEMHGVPMHAAPAPGVAAVAMRPREAAVHARSLTYWRERLGGTPMLQLPTDRSRVANARRRGAKLFRRLSAATTETLETRAHASGVTAFTVFLTAFRTVLSAWSRQADFAIGVAVLNRQTLPAEDRVGLAANLLALRLSLDGRGGFWQAVAREWEQLLASLEHQDVPFDEVVEVVSPMRSATTDPLVQVMYVHHEREQTTFHVPGCVLEPLDVVLHHARFELTLMTVRVGGQLSISIEYDADLFQAGTVGRMADDFVALLERAASDPGASLSGGIAVQPLMRGDAADAANALPLGARLRRLWASHQDAVAMRFGSENYTFAWMFRLAQSVAAELAARRIGLEDRVAVALPRGPKQVASLWGVLLAGAAFAPVDPSAPTERQNTVLALLRPVAILVSRAQRPLAPPPGAVLLEIEAIAARSAQPVPEPPLGLAYVATTSGSEGKPKAVAAPRLGLLNRLDWMARAIHWEPGDVAAARTPPAFVDFVCESLGPTAAAVTLAIASDAEIAEPAALLAFLRRENVTRLVATPTILRELDAADRAMQSDGRGVPTLRVVISSGEALASGDVAATRQLAPGAELWNLYGASEIAADATAARIASVKEEPSLGAPIDGIDLLLIDRWGGSAPRGAVGEILVAGAGAARGYLDDPAGTAAAFPPAPWSGIGARCFATGDHGRLDAADRLLFAGRPSGRVELGGVRVEIHEMERLLRGDPAVADAAVFVTGEPARSVARVTSKTPALDATALRRRLLARAPAYLVPGSIEVGSLPRTPSGKIDYPALVAAARSPGMAGSPPATPLERAVAEAWSEVLGRPVDDRAADFFALGGHSLSAARAARRLEERLGKAVPLTMMLVSPVLYDVAAALQEAPEYVAETLTPAPLRRFEPFALTPMQEAYVAGRGEIYEGGGVGLHGYAEIEGESITVAGFEHAINALVARHDMLRAVLLADGRQRVLPDVPPYRIRCTPLVGLSAAAMAAEQAKLRVTMAAQVIDLAAWPCFDIRATLPAGGPPRFHVSFDGTFIDAWSQSLLLRELLDLLAGGSSVYRPATLTFRDYAEAVRTQRSGLAYERAIADWRARLPELPDAPQLPGPAAGRPAGPLNVSQISALVPPAIIARLRTKAAGESGLISVLLAAFAIVLSRWGTNPRMLLNVPVSGRLPLHADVDRLIGPFGDFIYTAFDLAAPQSFAEVVRAARRELAWALDRALVCGMTLARELALARGFHVPTPIVFTSLNFETGADPLPHSDAFTQVFGASQTPQVYLDNRVRLEADGGVRITWDVAAGMFAPDLPEKILSAYCELLTAAADADWDGPAMPGDIVPMPPVPESLSREMAWCGPLGSCFWELRERQGSAAAVVFPGGCWSYDELGSVALAVAGDLDAAGVGRGDIVVIALEKGPEQVAAVLGVLRVGAAYAPIDPEHPAERLTALLASLSPRVAIVAKGLPADWLGGTPQVSVAPPGAQMGVAPLGEAATGAGVAPNSVGQSDLAYIIHTSGSTGRPKGVMITHGAAWNTIAAVNARLGLGPTDCVMSVSALTFDLSVWDILGPLSVGAAVATPRGSSVRDPAAWLRLADAAGVSVWNSAPGLMGAALERGGVGLSRLRWALLSGDFIPLSLPDAIRTVAPGCRVLSLGGATEAAIWSVWREVDGVDPSWRSIPYGRALPGQSAFVVDEGCRLRPIWAEGEIVIGGAGLALGYWCNPQETEARFIRHPGTGERLYRTGDRGRIRPDGEIDILGRIDRQVKIAGHRIEPGEVEAAIASCSGLSPGLSHCVVIPAGTGAGPDHLVAHLVRARETVQQSAVVADRADLQKLALRGRNSSVRALPDASRIDLGVGQEAIKAIAAQRRSRRIFANRTIHRRALGQLLAHLAQTDMPGGYFPKRSYGSAGNLYPIQCYLIIRPGAVAGVEGGHYYFDPRDTRLARLGTFEAADDDLAGGANTDLYRAATFAIILVAEMTTIRQVYPMEAERFVALEAGLIAQLLETVAPRHGLGLCQIGVIDAARVAAGCLLSDSHLVMHALVGGPIAAEEADPLADAYYWRRAASGTAAWLDDRRCEMVLRQRLGQILPRQLRPSRYVFWEALPLTSNGKVDYAALQRAGAIPAEVPAPPVPAESFESTRGAVVAQSAQDDSDIGTVQRVAAIWQEILGTASADPDEHFLAAGGTSLQAIRLMAAIEAEFSRAPEIADFMLRPTISALAEALAQLPADGATPRWAWTPDSEAATAPFPLTAMQQAYVVARSGALAGAARSARSYFEVDLDGLDLPRFERALARLIARHGMLRARFDPPREQWIPAQAPAYQMAIEDLSGMPADATASRLAALRAMIATRNPPLTDWPLFDLHAALLAGGTTRLFFGLDLIICDARSFQVLLHDLMATYAADKDDALPALGLSFRDHVLAMAALRAGPRGARDRRYWLDQLDALPPAPQLPARSEANIQTSGFRRLTARLGHDNFARLRARAAHHGATLSGALCAAFACVLGRWARTSSFTVNVTTFGRQPIHPDVERLVGDFTSSILLAVDVAASDFASLAAWTQHRLLANLEHASFGGVDVLRHLNRSRQRVGGFEAPVVFTSLVDSPAHAIPVPEGLSSRLVYAVSQTPDVALDHQVFEIDGTLSYNWDFAGERFPDGLIERAFAEYGELLDRLAETTEAWTEPLVAHRTRIDQEEPPSKHATVGESGQAATRALPPEAARVCDMIMRFFTEKRGLEEILATDRPLSLGADSIDLLQLAADIEVQFGRQVDIARLFENPTLHDLSLAIVSG